jgi:aminoglycoside 6-adenylyltransferase
MTGPMDDHATMYEEIIDRFVAWADTRDDIVAAIIVGSRARTDHPADAWSDLDLVIFSSDPGALLDDEAWLEAMGEPLITFREPTAVGIWEERRVLFANGCDADFSVLPADLVQQLHVMQPGDALYDETASVISRGCRVVVDTAGGLANTVSRIASHWLPVPMPPTQDVFEVTANDFWYHCVWTARKLRRGELMVAHECLDGNQRYLLMQMIRWLAERDGTVWHGTRYMEEWAPSHVMERLPATWAVHTRDDILRALVAMMDLVADLTLEIATAYELDMSRDEESSARAWVRQVSGE